MLTSMSTSMSTSTSTSTSTTSTNKKIEHNYGSNNGSKYFPTSEDFYKRILSDRNISSSHVSIVYFDNVVVKYLEKRVSAWKEVSKGGDVPWHRVYFFKYKDKIIWDRDTKTCNIDELISERRPLKENFKIITYNILNDKTLHERAINIINFIE